MRVTFPLRHVSIPFLWQGAGRAGLVFHACRLNGALPSASASPPAFRPWPVIRNAARDFATSRLVPRQNELQAMRQRP